MAFDLRRLLGLDHPQAPPPRQQLPMAQHQAPVQQPLQVQPQHAPANLGVPYSPNADSGLGQGGAFNPGFTPLQNSGFGAQGTPQIGAFNQPTQQVFDPQNNRRQQYWLQ